MQFYKITLWYTPCILTASFFFFFCRSFYLLGDLLSENPLFEKKRAKYINQLNSFTNRFTPVVLAYYSVLFFANCCSTNVYHLNSGLNANFLPLLFIVLYTFLKVGEFIYGIALVSDTQRTQTINSSGLFILTFIPIATALLFADNLIDLLLPLELLGLMFYFIFLEFNYLSHSKANNPKNQTTTIMRGLLYYFWLSFVGSLFFVLSGLLASTFLPSVGFNLFTLVDAYSGYTKIYLVLISFLIFLGLMLKMGGLFFFFFKSDLYKLLPIYGVLVFSVYTTVLYLLLLVYLVSAIPMFSFCCKLFVSGFLLLITTIALFIGNLSQKNTLYLLAFSSVLTVCFCVLVIV